MIYTLTRCAKEAPNSEFESGKNYPAMYEYFQVLLNMLRIRERDSSLCTCCL